MNEADRREDKADEKSDRSLIEELEALDVVEAHELQEGVAFHAFRFR